MNGMTDMAGITMMTTENGMTKETDTTVVTLLTRTTRVGGI